MSTRRTTSDKRQRERDKQAKAAAKRARRQDRSIEDGIDTTDPTIDRTSTTEQLLERVEALHAEYDAGNLSFEEFDEQKSSLLDDIAIRLAQ